MKGRRRFLSHGPGDGSGPPGEPTGRTCRAGASYDTLSWYAVCCVSFESRSAMSVSTAAPMR